MWTLRTAEGRQARWCAPEVSGLDEMVAELYGSGAEVTVTALAGPPTARSRRSSPTTGGRWSPSSGISS